MQKKETQKESSSFLIELNVVRILTHDHPCVLSLFSSNYPISSLALGPHVDSMTACHGPSKSKLFYVEVPNQPLKTCKALQSTNQINCLQNALQHPIALHCWPCPRAAWSLDRPRTTPAWSKVWCDMDSWPVAGEGSAAASKSNCNLSKTWI